LQTSLQSSFLPEWLEPSLSESVSLTDNVSPFELFFSDRILHYATCYVLPDSLPAMRKPFRPCLQPLLSYDHSFFNPARFSLPFFTTHSIVKNAIPGCSPDGLIVFPLFPFFLEFSCSLSAFPAAFRKLFFFRLSLATGHDCPSLLHFFPSAAHPFPPRWRISFTAFYDNFLDVAELFSSQSSSQGAVSLSFLSRRPFSLSLTGFPLFLSLFAWFLAFFFIMRPNATRVFFPFS